MPSSKDELKKRLWEEFESGRITKCPAGKCPDCRYIDLFLSSTIDQAYEVIHKAHDILNSDFAFEADCVKLDDMQGRAVTEREKQLAKVITDLYMLIHPYMDCGTAHEDWKAKFLYDPLKKENS